MFTVMTRRRRDGKMFCFQRLLLLLLFSIFFFFQANNKKWREREKEEEMLSWSRKKSQVTYFSELALIFSRKEREIMWSLAVKKAFRFRFIVGEGRWGERGS